MSDYVLTIKRVYRRDQGSNLEEALTISWTDGDNLEVETVVDFSPDGGSAVFEPGTVRAETFEYGGIDEDLNELTGVIRPNTRYAHKIGTFVQEGSEPTTEMLVDGYMEDEEEPVVGLGVPAHLEFLFAVGARDQETMETVTVRFADEEDLVVASGPIGTPAILRSDNNGVKIDTKRESVTIGAAGLFEQQDVAGSPPAGVAGVMTTFYDSAGASGAGLYARFGTGAITLIKAF